ncbi:copper amine oxidase 1 [Aspergillus bombycis]|uniref:Amine oxidase n=1 Tax=Aspergillus bombycis TaxID=109264 RepID=A0A1F7ZLH7_9EURO|nr:copper amine oxidase 1 [Aspergillus bombycis]OGM40294.1 copper amine oxidase 1 [Aspergillus bombycis]
MSLHPLGPATPREIQLATDLVKKAYEDVTNNQLIHHAELPRDFHGPVDRAEMNEATQVVMADPRVKEEINRLKIDDTTVILDPWGYGVDGEETQCFMYMRNPRNNDPDSNHYCFPLDFMVTVDFSGMKVEQITRLPLGCDQATTPVGSPVPYRRTDPYEAEYDHSLQKKAPRTTVKPYQVIQPEGASFTVKGHLVEWEKC